MRKTPQCGGMARREVSPYPDHRRVSSVAVHLGEGPLTERTASVQPARQEQVFMPHTRRSRYPPGSAQLGLDVSRPRLIKIQFECELVHTSPSRIGF